MADDVVLSAGSGGDTIAADEISLVKYQRVKITLGGDGTNDGDVASGNPMPVSGTVTANAGTNLNTSALALESGGNLATVAGAVRAEDSASATGHVGIGALAIQRATPGDTAADLDYSFLQMSAGRLWASATIDAALPAGTNAIGTLAANSGVDIGDVDVISCALPTGASTLAEQQTQTTALQLIDDGVYTDDTSTHSTGTSKGYGIMAVATPTDAAVNANDFGHLAMTTDRKLHVSVQDALPAGTNAIGKLASNTGVDIGDVDVTSAIITGGSVAHDAGDSGNPIKIGAKAETSPKAATLVADADRTDLYADADGMLMVKLNTSGADIVSERVTNTDGNSTAFSNFSAVASTKNYITAITVFRSDAGTSLASVDFRDGTAGSVLWSMPLPPNGGSVITSPTPLFKTSANTALAFDVSAALSTVTICVSGYQSKV